MKYSISAKQNEKSQEIKNRLSIILDNNNFVADEECPEIVFVIGVNAEKFPSMIEGDGESEANLFYVAITRAKEELYVSSSNPSQYFSKFINLLEEYEEEKCLE